MIAPSPATNVTAAAKDERDGSLPPLLFVLTIVTGLVDAVSYLKLGHVFVANMTGNVVFLGFAVAGAPDFSIPASLVAIASFLVGAVTGGRLASSMPERRTRFFAIAILVKLALVGVALIVAIAMVEGDLVRYALIVLLALAMGLYIYKIRSGSTRGIREATIGGCVLLGLALVFGKIASDSS